MPKFRTPDTFRKWISCRLILQITSNEHSFTFDSELAVFRTPICGNWRQGGPNAHRDEVTIDLFEVAKVVC